MKARGRLIGLPLLGLLMSFGASEVTAQSVYWTDIGSSKVQRLDLHAGAGVEDLLTVGQVATHEMG